MNQIFFLSKRVSQKGCQALFKKGVSGTLLCIFKKGCQKKGVKKRAKGVSKGVSKRGVRHSFMHFLSFILISLFLFFSTCGKKSPNPPVRQKRVSVATLKHKKGVTKRVSKKGCQALFYVPQNLTLC